MPYTSAKKECILVFIILTVSSHSSYQTPQDADADTDTPTSEAEKCFTPSNEAGICVPKEECQSLIILERRFSSTHKVVSTFLKQSLCQNETLSCCSNKELQNQTNNAHNRFGDENSIISFPVDFDEKINILPSDCGKRITPIGTRITGGSPASLGEYPWIVALGFRNRSISASDAIPHWRCGGSLITDRHIVTAAHCHHNDIGLIMYVARVGELNLDETQNDGAKPEDIILKKVIPHPDHTIGGYTNDIAVAVLEKSVQFSRNVKPICLPVSKENRNKWFENAAAFIAGWGSMVPDGHTVPELRHAQIDVVSNEQECKPRYAVDSRAVIDNRIICAGVPSGEFDACQGDSGGPLMTDVDTTLYLVGVVSYGDKCAKPKTPGVYTRVTFFLDWILKTIAAEAA